MAQTIVAASTASAGPNLLYLRKLRLPTPQFEAIGVVDMDRLLAVRLPASDSPEARADVIRDIQRATAFCAAAHDCVVVLDFANDCQNGFPIVLSAVGRLDLTEEVVQQLTQ